ncbi:mucin-2-like [Ylistrum balloti]|uniref:mucin-2-like n=1 Tax=Ylistrum balloti TaxID=509963 RepID=UPI0029059E5F|nr:mucin-2-like [Ylistrum balloti]
MTTQRHMLWTLLSVTVSLMCAYSVNRECQEMALCTDELISMNETITFHMGTSQMINICTQLEQNYPPCFEKAKSACSLSRMDTYPYLLRYYSVKESCNEVCPIFKPLINCEENLAYIDLSTSKKSYCRSYIESMECLDSILINMTCSFGEQTKANILDTVYDQDARQFGDGVCMTARDCTDVDDAVREVNYCLLEWNKTRDYSESGTDTLKACVSKISTCSDALKMVPYYENSLVGIDVTAAISTETGETTTVATTDIMTSSVGSPAPSTIDTSVRTLNTIHTGVVDVTTELYKQPLNPTDITEDTSALPTTDLVTKPFKRSSFSTRGRLDSVDITEDTSALPTTDRVTKPFKRSSFSTRGRLDSVDITEDTSALPTTDRVTKPFKRSSVSTRGRGLTLFTSQNQNVVTRKMSTGTKLHVSTTAFIPDDSTTSNRKSVTLVLTKSSASSDTDGGLTEETEIHKVTPQKEISSVLSPRRPISTEDVTTRDEVFTTPLLATDAGVLTETTTLPLSTEHLFSQTKTDQSNVSIMTGLADRRSTRNILPHAGTWPQVEGDEDGAIIGPGDENGAIIGPWDEDGALVGPGDEDGAVIGPEMTKETTTFSVKMSSAKIPSGRETTRTQYSSGGNRVETPLPTRPSSKKDPMTEISPTEIADQTKTSSPPEQEDKSTARSTLNTAEPFSVDTNGGVIKLRAGARSTWIMMTVLFYCIT